ncbi:MAG TPA: hypothetical protein VNQ76_10770 [Planctomicrobium sp.]|nr:hypothetical protein [Planctomicrobium sp.]
MLWNLIQQAQIERARATSQNAKSTARDAQSEIRFLKDRVHDLELSLDRLSLATMAIAEILRDRSHITEEEIEAKIEEIDLRDGKLDGRLREPVTTCTSCDRTNPARRSQCLYCGESLPVRSTIFSPGSPEK